MIFTIIIFLIVLSLLVFVHELGHFVVAKRSGMKVTEFGFGFPPRMFGIQKVDGKWKFVWGHKDPQTDDTTYSINWIPLGGFVKIMGEDNDTEGDERSFINKPFWPRFFTLAAGVIMNFILAGVLFAVGYMAGLPVAVGGLDEIPNGGQLTNRQVAIIEVSVDSPAQKSGIMSGDIVEGINGTKFESVESLQDYIKNHKGEKVSFEVKRVNELKTIEVETLANPEVGKGSVGISLALYGKLQFGPIAAIGHGF